MGYRGRRRIRIKKTFNLPERAVEAIRELALLHDLADSQDAVVALAVSELMRRVAEHEEARLWERAAADGRFHDQGWELETAFGTASDESWPAEPN